MPSIVRTRTFFFSASTSFKNSETHGNQIFLRTFHDQQIAFRKSEGVGHGADGFGGPVRQTRKTRSYPAGKRRLRAAADPYGRDTETSLLKACAFSKVSIPFSTKSANPLCGREESTCKGFPSRYTVFRDRKASSESHRARTFSSPRTPWVFKTSPASKNCFIKKSSNVKFPIKQNRADNKPARISFGIIIQNPWKNTVYGRVRPGRSLKKSGDGQSTISTVTFLFSLLSRRF